MTESIQKRLARVRAPRVQITYDVETGGAIEKEELPFIVGILADLKGDAQEGAPPPDLKDRRLTDIDRDSFDDVLKAIAPGIALDLAPPELALLKNSDNADDKFITFKRLDDFHPLSLIGALPTLRDAYLARNQIRWLQSKTETNAKIATQLESWLKFNVAGENPAMPTVRGELSAALGGVETGGAALADADKIALRGKLIALSDALQTLDAANNPATPPADDAAVAAAKTAQDAAKAAALKVLATWSLAPDAGNGVSEDSVLDWGRLLARAMALSNTPENQIAAKALVKLLAEVPETDTKEPAKIARNTARAAATAALGLADAAAAQALATPLATSLESPDVKVSAPALDKALLLAGLRGAESRAGVPLPATPDVESVRNKYLNDCVAAEGRGAFLAVAKYLTTPTEPSKLLAHELMTMVERLGPSDVVRVPSIIHRLHFFVTTVLPLWRQENLDLLKAKPRGVRAVIDQRVAQIDVELSAALSAIMHAPRFSKLEASWRGLHFLVSKSLTNTYLKLKVLSATRDELLKDMQSAVEFDQSVLFKHIYEAEYGTYGGFPYSLLVGDFQIGGGADDIEFLKKMAEVAAAAHAPFITAADPSLFGLSNYDELAGPRDLSMVFDHQEMMSWREFRELDDARYVTLVLPRVLLRLPYGKPDKRNTIKCERLNFEEKIGATLPVLQEDGSATTYPKPVTDNFLWGNAAYVLAERITNAFSLYHWTAAIRGVEGGGLVEDLPAYSYTSDAGTVDLFCPTEVTITDRREKELSDLGFMALCHCKDTSSAAFFGGQTTNNPKTYYSSDANTNAKLSSRLPYMLAASRFAHYIKVMMRKKIGLFMTRANVESHLNNWIANYVLLDDTAPQEAKAAFPLRAAKVVVTEVAGDPGNYNATVFLKPHFQLEELSTSIRLVAKLPG
jgi:type VI secretion system ImpC/EvpB family protein/type VI secretion system ImpB/VipA family protein